MCGADDLRRARQAILEHDPGADIDAQMRLAHARADELVRTHWSPTIVIADQLVLQGTITDNDTLNRRTVGRQPTHA